MKLPFLARFLIVILIVIAMAEFAPDLVNAVLMLVLIGAILGNWQEFQGITKIIGSIGK